MKRQLAFLLSRAQVPIGWLQPPSDNAGEDADFHWQDELPKGVWKRGQVTDVKSLEDKYKSLKNTSEWTLSPILVSDGCCANVDSAGEILQVLPSTLLSTGFGNDKLKANEGIVGSKDGKEEKKNETKVDDTFQAFAVLGIVLIATMGEDMGAEMSMRQFNHFVSSSHINSAPG